MNMNVRADHRFLRFGACHKLRHERQGARTPLSGTTEARSNTGGLQMLAKPAARQLRLFDIVRKGISACIPLVFISRS
jgi:hypothetical protein